MRRRLFTFLAILLASSASGRSGPGALRLLISVEQPAITFPFPARITLQIHNAGAETLWVYRRARNPESVPQTLPLSDRPVTETTGGSTLSVKLEPVTGPPTPQDGVSVAQGRVIESVGLAKPKLERLGPGEDYDEKASLQLSPAVIESNGQKKPLWGRYRLSVVYGATYSNAEEIRRNLGAVAWQGEVESNRVEIELAPPPAGAQGSVSGAVVGAEGHSIPRARLSLVDEQEHVLAQAQADEGGRFSFAQLPSALYYVVASRPDPGQETAAFQRVLLTPTEPVATLQIIMLPPEIYEAKKILHKPVLFRVNDEAGRGLGNVQLEITWSSGTILDNVKGETGPDGIAPSN